MRMWSIGVDDAGDGTRLFKPRPGSREALKWLIEDLSGAMADPVRTTRANNALRQQVHRALVEANWAARITQVSFRLLRVPTDADVDDDEDRQIIASDEPAGVTADGVAITDVLASEVSTGRDTLRLASLEWSSWRSLDRALADAAWLAQRLTTLLTEGPSRSKEWAVAALRRAQLELCWVAAPDGPTDREWETVAMQELEDIALWNRARPAPREQTQRT